MSPLKYTAIIFAMAVCMASIDFVFVTADDNSPGDETQTPVTSLSTHITNYKELPMIGIAIGQQQNDDKNIIPKIVNKSISVGRQRKGMGRRKQRKAGYQLIDTTPETDFQTLFESLRSTTPKNYHPDDDNDENNIHITAKVPYTHLGYDRTILYVNKYLTDTNLPPNAKIHLLLYYPRCSSLHTPKECHEEENALPPTIKDAGPSPLLDKNMFLDSWRAFEELYITNFQIRSIGVAHFAKSDLDELLSHCKIIPHVYQGVVSQVFEEKREVFDLLWANRILFQVTDVYETVIRSREKRKNLNVKFLEFAIDNFYGVPIDTLIVTWFVQNRMGVILPSSNDSKDDDDNNDSEVKPLHVGMIRMMDHDQGAKLGDLIHATLLGYDLKQDVENGKVVLTIENKFLHKLVLFWVNGDSDNKEERDAGWIYASRKTSFTSLPGHQFLIKRDGEKIMEFTVDAERGEQQFVTVT